MAEKFRLAVSVGHTPEIYGALNKGTNLKEYDVCMRYRAPLLALLEADTRVVEFAVQPGVPLAERIHIINDVHKKDPFDLAIELHMNSFHRPDPQYSEVYHYAHVDKDTGKTVSSKMGQLYGDVFLNALAYKMMMGDGKNDGVSEPFGDEAWERERYGFVKGCLPPALVIEPTFLSNEDVVKGIITGDLIARMAIGCYEGVVACIEEVFK